MAYEITSDEYLEIDGYPLATPAVRVTNLSVLWEPGDVRGEDRLIPGAAGVVAYPRRPTVTRKVLELLVFGDRDDEGVPHADTRQGLYDNVKKLNQMVTGPVSASGDGTRDIVLHLPDGATTMSGRGHVIPPLFFVNVGPDNLRGTLDLSLPDGALTED
jgi:hypothetical protein